MIKKLYGATMVVSKEVEQDALFDLPGYVTERLIKMLENEAEKAAGFLDYDSITIERTEEEFGHHYQHVLSRKEMPLWRFVLSLLPGVRKPVVDRELPPLIRYGARALVEVPVEEEE